MEGTRDAHLRRKPGDLQSTTGGAARIGQGVLVVAAIHSPETLRAAEELRTVHGAAPDLLELRVDHFAREPEALAALAANPPRPLIVTVRRPDEGGGAPDLDDGQRRRLYQRFLGAAAGVDVETRSLPALADVVAEARRSAVRVIASFHDFQGTPSVARLRRLAGQAVDAGADVFKVAAVTNGPGELARLLDFLEEENRLPLAAMGMGRLGRASRLVLAAAGSVLNYGYLGEQAQVLGQWPAASLRERIDELEG